ncbi:MAG TPA: PAS domain S-box protein [Bryobacteraceae bacterium]|nr:PAS domain S-box protein [Bryobacteraceae bacterium]
MSPHTRELSTQLFAGNSFDALTAAVPDMVWLKDLNGVYLACNSAAADFLGLPESDVIGKTDYDLYPKDEAETLRSGDRTAAASPEPMIGCGWATQRRHGRRALLEILRNPVRNAEGTVTGVVGVALDITITRQADLLAAQEEVGRIVEAVPGVIFSYRLRPDGTAYIPFANSAIEEICGVRREDAAQDASSAWAMVHPDDRGARAGFEAAMRSLSPWQGSFRIRHPVKGDAWLEGHSIPVKEADGSVLAHGFLTEVTRRKRLEKALRVSQQQLNEAQRLAGIGSWTWDADTGQSDWSEALYHLAGRDPRSPPPTLDDLKAIHTPESWRRLWQALERARDTGESYELDLELVLPDGQRAWRTSRGACVRDANGRIVGLHGTSQDITARKLAEERTRAAHAELGAIHAHSPVAYLVVDQNLKVERVNEAATRAAGRPPLEMIGLAPGGSINCANSMADPRGCGYGPPCGACALRRAVTESVQQGKRCEGIEAALPVLTAGGVRQRQLLVFTAPLEIDGERKALVSLLDITDWKRAQIELEASEARFRRLMEDAPIAISMSRDGRICYANPICARMFGFRNAGELDGLPVMECFAPVCRGSMQEINERRAEGLHVPREFEATGLRADGSEFPMLLAVIMMNFVEGPAKVAFITDLTALKHGEEERLRLEQRYRQAQKLESIGRLAGGVAHDFNNLLTVINGYCAMLLEQVSKLDPIREGLEEILHAGERAAGLTQQLLAFSRKQVLEVRVLNLNQVVGEMRPMLSRLLGDDVVLSVKPHPRPAIVRADRHQLEQIVMNLAVNSRDAMPHGGEIRVETDCVFWDDEEGHLYGAPAGPYVRLSVSDNGVGMDEETRQRVFEPFFTTKEVGKGTGLGLSMVQGIVAQSGGVIDVQSELNCGTTFAIFLPRAEETSAEVSLPDAIDAAIGSGTILVVEDQAEVRKYVAQALRARGYQVIAASRATDAIEICEQPQQRIDLVLTDVVMPQMSGRALADQLRKRWPALRVLFTSGYTDDTIVRHRVLENDAEFLQKPFSPSELAAKVRKLLAPAAASGRILVADDDAGIRRFLRNLLERGGYAVFDAADGKEAVQEARARPLDLVITDLVMPEQEGIETIRVLRAELPDIGIIAISGAFGGQFLKVAEVMGADAVMTKPISPEKLLAKVSEILAVRRSTG